MGCIVSGPFTAPEIYGAAAGLAGASLSVDRSNQMPAHPIRPRPVPSYTMATEEPGIPSDQDKKAPHNSASNWSRGIAEYCPPAPAAAVSGSKQSLFAAAPEADGVDAMLWKRVGVVATSSRRRLGPPPPPPPLDFNPSRPPAVKTAIRPDRTAAATTAASAGRVDSKSREEDDEDENEEPAPLTRAVSSFGQNRILAMFGSGLASAAGGVAAGRRRPAGRDV